MPNSFCVRHGVYSGRQCFGCERDRGSAAARGYDRGWQTNAAAFLEANPRCVDCGAPATIPAHVIPRERGGSDAWSNLRPKCDSCHSRETAVRESGWSRAEAIA